MAGGSMFLERKHSWVAVISRDVSFPPAHDADSDVSVCIGDKGAFLGSVKLIKSEVCNKIDLFSLILKYIYLRLYVRDDVQSLQNKLTKWINMWTWNTDLSLIHF